jgi:hypothetical protein
MDEQTPMLSTRSRRKPRRPRRKLMKAKAWLSAIGRRHRGCRGLGWEVSIYRLWGASSLRTFGHRRRSRARPVPAPRPYTFLKGDRGDAPIPPLTRAKARLARTATPTSSFSVPVPA